MGRELSFIHTNLHLLLRRNLQYCQGETKMWDIARNKFDSHDDDVYINIYTKIYIYKKIAVSLPYL